MAQEVRFYSRPQCEVNAHIKVKHLDCTHVCVDAHLQNLQRLLLPTRVTFKDTGCVFFYCTRTFSGCLCRLHYSKSPMCTCLKQTGFINCSQCSIKMSMYFSHLSIWLQLMQFYYIQTSDIFLLPLFNLMDNILIFIVLHQSWLNLQIKIEPTHWWQKQESVFFQSFIVHFVYVSWIPERQKTKSSVGENHVFIQTQTKIINRVDSIMFSFHHKYIYFLFFTFWSFLQRQFRLQLFCNNASP